MKYSVSGVMRWLTFLVALFPSALPAVVMVFTENPWTQLDVYPRATVAADGHAITVDGDLSDWNSAAFYHFYNNELVKDQFAFRSAFAYDDKGLLFAARFTDRNPLLNHCNPAVSPKEGWNGDSFQFRLTGNLKPVLRDKSDNIALVTIWHYTDKRLPVLHIAYGTDMHEQLVRTGAESGLAVRAVENGYVIEGHIPYEWLRQPPPAPGAQWRFQVQGNFSDAAGKSVHVVYECFTKQVSFFNDPTGWGSALFVKPDGQAARLEIKRVETARKRSGPAVAGLAAIPFTYQNPGDGYVSLAARNDAGRIVRTLRMKSRQTAGVVTDAWDGLDDNGQPVSAGAYTIHGISHPGLQSRFVTSVHNSGQPPWQGTDSSAQWGGDHGPAVDVTTDAEGSCYLAWDAAEKGHDLIKVNRDGRKVWGVNSPFRDQVIAVAHQTGRIYLANSGEQGVIMYDATTGNRLLLPDGKSLLVVSTNHVRNKLAVTLPPECENPPFNLADIIATEGHLFCALHKENEIRVFRLDTFAPVAVIAIEHPLSLSWNATNNSLHCISRNNLIRIEKPLGPEPRLTTLAPGLVQPYGLAVDGDGVSWVGLRGKSQQVVGFDAKGKPVRAIGKAGGRPWVGAYDPAGMLQPAGIALDGLGRLWVAEQDSLPRRQSVWDLKTGKLVREFFGGSAYSPMMAPDLDAPENVFLHNTRFVVDYDTGRVTPAATVYRKDYVPRALLGAEYRYEFMGQTFQIATYQGKKFAYDGHGGVYAYGDAEFKPLTHVGQAFRGLPGMTRENSRREIGRGFSAVWRDANGDGRFSDDEVRMIKDLTLTPNIGFGGAFFPGAKFNLSRKIFAPQTLNARGAPVYPEPEDAPPILTGDGPMKQLKNWLDVWPSLKDDWRSFYAIASVAGNAYLGDNVTDGIYKFNRAGDILWRYAPVAVGFGLKKNLSKPGEMFGALRILGLIEMPPEHGGEIVGIGCYRGYTGFLTEDSLFIDHFGSDVGYGPPADYNTLFVENFSGYLFKHPRTGKVYLFTGVTDGRIIELSGWENIRRLAPVTIAVTEAQRAQAAQTLAATQAGGKIVTALRVTSRAKGWADLAAIPFGNGHQARVGLAWDAQHLYARFEVEDPTPWQNTSKDWRYDFKGGDAVDIQIGSSRTDKQKVGNTFLPGDARVLIAPDDNKTGFNAVAMWKRAPEGLAKEPLTYNSPVATEDFERVELLQDVRLEFTKTETGYVAEVSIPWSALHRKPPPKGQMLLGDLGVLLSDQSGARTVLRRHLFNKDTNIVDDIPSESRIAPRNWGRLEFVE